MNSLVVEHLFVRYGARSHPAVSDVSFEVPAGRNVGIIGESGSGKSSLAKAIVGLAPIAGGCIRLGAQTLCAPGSGFPATARSKVQLVFQNAGASLNPRMTVGQAIGESLRLRSDIAGGARARSAQVSEYLERVGLPGLVAQRYPHQLSGGQKQRVCLARALALRPQIIILDEATSSLDVSAQAQMLDLLSHVQDEMGVTYLVISHDLAVVSQLCEHLVVMYRSHVVERGPAIRVLSAPRHPYTHVLRQSTPTIRRRDPASVISELQDVSADHLITQGCPFHPRCFQGPARRPDRVICVTSAPDLVNGVACHFPLRDSDTSDAMAPAGLTQHPNAHGARFDRRAPRIAGERDGG